MATAPYLEQRHTPLPYLPDCLKQIIEKKVNQTALNFFEKMIDLFCTYFCCHAYNQWYGYCLARREYELSAVRDTQQVQVIRLNFSDGTPIIARVQNVQVEIRPNSYVIPPRMDATHIDEIYLNGRKVVFNPFDHLIFSREALTERLFIDNINPLTPNEVHFIEVERLPNTNTTANKYWTVDLNKIFIKRVMFGQLPFSEEEVYVVENQIQNALPSEYERRFS